MSARAVIAIVVAVALGIGAIALWRARQPDDTAWRSYKQRFVATDGRVIDTGNKNVSHTEGQGYAMLFAAGGRRPRHLRSHLDVDPRHPAPAGRAFLLALCA